VAKILSTFLMMESMLAAFAEFDNNVRTERSINGMRERLKQGVWV
jgi:DNA invertase Pin-like site-specific DNA recombinase